VVVTASTQDRDGAKPALLETYLRTGVRFVFADGAFASRLLDWAHTLLRTTLHIVRKPADQRGFAVIPRRWAVERTLCAARRSLVSPVQPGGIWREVPGSNG
jgi:putative transposase